MMTDFADQNELLFFTPHGNVIDLVSLDMSNPLSHRLELPFNIKSLHPLNRDQYLVVASHSGDEGIIPSDNLFSLKKADPEDPVPTMMNPISQPKSEEDHSSGGSKVLDRLSSALHSSSRSSSAKTQEANVSSILKAGNKGLSKFGLSRVFNEPTDSPNTLLSTHDAYAALVMGFPELEFSPNEVHVWPRPSPLPEDTRGHPGGGGYYASAAANHKKYDDPSKSLVFLPESCQVVRPVAHQDLPAECKNQQQGPANVTAYLEVVDLLAQKLRYIPVPEPAQMSTYAAWYKQTYPDQLLALAKTSNEGLVSVDNVGTLRLWETGVANLSRSMSEWKRMIGETSEDRDLSIQRNHVGGLDTPKHGQIDPKGAPHVGGNTWAGGTGGRDTAGLGGIGGPYRLDAGHDVHQVSDDLKEQVPEHIRKAAREMNRKAYEERLREIRMSEYDAELYEQYASGVRKQVQTLRLIINGLQAKAQDRQWLKNQTSGELDDTKLIEGITGEKAIYKKRSDQEPEPGAPQEKPKRLRLLVDVSGSMYRFNGHDQRLERMMESALMVMEALEGYSDRIRYDIVGHSGEEPDIPFVRMSQEPKNARDRLQVLRNMHAHAQFCMSGDHTLAGTVQAINELAADADNHDECFVIVLSDANFDRYGISPSSFAKILNRQSDKVNAFSIFIGSLGDQADRLTQKLPAGKGFVCLDTRKIPEILKAIFTSTMLK